MFEEIIQCSRCVQTEKYLADELFECVDHFVGLALKGLRPCQTSMIGPFAKIIITAVNYFLKKSLSETLERLNTPWSKFT